MARSYPDFPWCCIAVFVLALASGIYKALMLTPFTIDPIVAVFFGIGGFALIIALVEIKERSDGQRVVKIALQSHKKGRIPVKDLSEEVEMTERGFRRAVTDLRTKGATQAYFDPKSGDMIIGSELEAEAPKAREQANYCQYCGARIPPAARFCVNCGANVEQTE